MAFSTAIHTSKKFRLGERKTDVSGNVFVYGKGGANVAAGSWVTYDEAFAPTLLAADAAGPVAISMSANTSATNYSWYQIYGYNTISKSDTTAADKALYADGTAGRVDDAGSAGDLVVGAWSMDQDTSNVLPVFITYPGVYNSGYLT